MRKLEVNQMKNLEGRLADWRCAAGIAGRFLAGMASCTGNGVVFTLGPVGVTWGCLKLLI